MTDATGYAMVLTPGGNGDGPAWTATVEELPGCAGHGPTPEQAAAEAGDAVARWVREAEAAGREIPPPGAAAAHSGKLLVRMPRSLHAELTRASEREGTSLNAYIVGVLAASIAWRRPERAAGENAPATRSPALSRALIANLVVLALVTIVAVALLVTAWND